VLSSSALETLRIFLDELTRWNAKINLTGLKSRERIINELLLDCFVPLPFLPQEARLLDVGAGAGFPGLVIKICIPSLRVSLLEPNGKKAAFLRQVARLCGLGQIQVIQSRAESKADELASEGYEVVTARALAGLEETLTLCAPWTMRGGLFVSFQGADAAARLEACRPLLDARGLVLAQNLGYAIPGKQGERHVLIFRREA
jgi:16S rRNA (guanine527-N7)-methyltransferase